MQPRFILFGFDYYYPTGGTGDIHGWFNSADDALEAAQNIKESYKSQNYRRYDYLEILDTETGDATLYESKHPPRFGMRPTYTLTTHPVKRP